MQEHLKQIKPTDIVLLYPSGTDVYLKDVVDAFEDDLSIGCRPYYECDTASGNLDVRQTPEVEENITALLKEAKIIIFCRSKRPCKEKGEQGFGDYQEGTESEIIKRCGLTHKVLGHIIYAKEFSPESNDVDDFEKVLPGVTKRYISTTISGLKTNIKLTLKQSYDKELDERKQDESLADSQKRLKEFIEQFEQQESSNNQVEGESLNSKSEVGSKEPKEEPKPESVLDFQNIRFKSTSDLLCHSNQKPCLVIVGPALCGKGYLVNKLYEFAQSKKANVSNYEFAQSKKANVDKELTPIVCTFTSNTLSALVKDIVVGKGEADLTKLIFASFAKDILTTIYVNEIDESRKRKLGKNPAAFKIYEALYCRGYLYKKVSDCMNEEGEGSGFAAVEKILGELLTPLKSSSDYFISIEIQESIENKVLNRDGLSSSVKKSIKDAFEIISMAANRGSYYGTGTNSKVTLSVIISKKLDQHYLAQGKRKKHIYLNGLTLDSCQALCCHALKSSNLKDISYGKDIGKVIHRDTNGYLWYVHQYIKAVIFVLTHSSFDWNKACELVREVPIFWLVEDFKPFFSHLRGMNEAYQVCFCCSYTGENKSEMALLFFEEADDIRKSQSKLAGKGNQSAEGHYVGYQLPTTENESLSLMISLGLLTVKAHDAFKEVVHGNEITKKHFKLEQIADWVSE